MGPAGERASRARPGLPVAAVARRLGIAPATLRTWALRYGLGPADHVAGAHRRYDEADLARLETMRRLTQEGVLPVDAARVALAGTAPEDGDGLDGALAVPRRGGTGGRLLALQDADELTRGLGRAARSLDAAAVTAAVRRHVAELGVLSAWEQVLTPVLVSAGDRWAATGAGVEVEHLLAECVEAVLREVADAATEPPGARPVLLACVPDELHSLPLYALAAALAERGVGTRMLGAALPPEALAAAVRRTGPAVVFLWSQRPGTAEPAVISALPATRPPTAVVLGGPGWVHRPRRPGVPVATDLRGALSLVHAALGPWPHRPVRFGS